MRFTESKIVCLRICRDQPLGQACGNFLEIQETVRCLSGEGPEDLEELVVVQGAQMLILAGLASSLKEGVATYARIVTVN